MPGDGGREPLLTANRYATQLCVTLEVWLLACLTLTLPFVIIDATANGNDVWGVLNHDSADETATEAHHHWCEAIQPTRFVRTPFNSYSALGFTYLGLLVLSIVYFYDAWPALNHFRVFLLYNWFFALALIFGGIGSFLNHAAVVGGWADMIDRIAIWPLVLLPAFFFAMRLVPLPTEQWVYWTSSAILLFVAFLLMLPHLLEVETTSKGTTLYLYYGVPGMSIVFIILVVARLIAEPFGWYPKSASSIGLLVLSLAFAVVAFALQRPERLGVCDPHGAWFLNTHLWWHIFQALSVFLVWLWCYFEDVADEAYMAVATELRAKRAPRLRLLPNLTRLLLLQPARPRARPEAKAETETTKPKSDAV